MPEPLFARVAAALYPDLWVSNRVVSLASALDVDQRTVERWYSGAMFPPAGVWSDLDSLLAEMAQPYLDMRAEIAQMQEKSR